MRLGRSKRTPQGVAPHRSVLRLLSVLAVLDLCFIRGGECWEVTRQEWRHVSLSLLVLCLSYRGQRFS